MIPLNTGEMNHDPMILPAISTIEAQLAKFNGLAIGVSCGWKFTQCHPLYAFGSTCNQTEAQCRANNTVRS